jgi:asparagine synthase (glutamine-hydrolysing)
MSGFLALLWTDGQEASAELISRLAEDMTYRGPSRSAFLAHGEFAAGISVVAPDSAALDQHDGCIIAGTIRLHARADLIGSLAAAGLRCHGEMVDGALMLRAYAAWGMACVERVLGDFAFAVWDTKNRRLFAATDRFSIRPVYFAQTAQGVLVGNSIGTMLQSGWVGTALDESAIADFLALGLNSDPAGTFYKDVRSLPPAHCLISDASGTRARGYWSVPTPNGYRFHRSVDDYADELLTVLQQAVADRLPAQGPIHLTLSGGMDSGSIAGAIFSLLGPEQTKARLKAHTIVYGSLLKEEEGRYATLLGGHLGVSPQFLTAEDFMFRREDGGGAWNAPQPGPMHFLSAEYQIAKRSLTDSGRVLAGFGGDPLFLLHSPTVFDLLRQQGADAPVTIARYLLQCRKFPPLGLRRAIGQRLRRQPDTGLPLWIDPDLVRRTNLTTRVTAFHESELRMSPHAAMSGPFWKALFAQSDPGQLGLPLESSYPFFDSRIMNSLVNVPPPLLRHKSLLRHAMRYVLPAETLRRPKTSLGLASLPYRQRPEVQARQHRLIGEVPSLAQYANVAVLRRCIDEPQTGTSASLQFTEQLAFWLGSVRVNPSCGAARKWPTT